MHELLWCEEDKISPERQALAEDELNDKWNVAFNVDNLPDERYYQATGTSTGGNWYGEPRSFTLTLRGAF